MDSPSITSPIPGPAIRCTPESTAAFAYGAFAATMTIGRLLADRISARFGPVAVLRYVLLSD